MQETPHDYHTSVSIGGRPICKLRFSDIDLTGGSSSELRDLVSRAVQRGTAHGMEVSTDSKTMTNSSDNITPDISMNGQKLEQV